MITINIIDLENQIGDLETKLEQLQKELTYILHYDLHEEYDQMLDELYEEQCTNLPVCISGSELIKEFDPIAYRCGYSDFIDGYDFSALPEYIDLENEIESIESDIESLQEEIDELQEELEELEEE